MPGNRLILALMDPNAPVGHPVWPRIAVGDFLFVYAGQSVGIVIMRVCIEFPQKGRQMIMEFDKPGFPSERHDDMLVDERRVGNDPRFLVFALIKRNG